MQRFLIPFATTLALLTACGGGGEETTTPSTTTTSTESTETTPAPSTGYEAIEVTDGGNVTGRITYSGDQTDEILAITQDTETCAHEHPERPAGALVVNEGGLLNAVVYIEGISKGKAFADDGPPVIDNIDCAFTPRVSVAHKGGDIIARNSDPVTHNTNMTLTQRGRSIMNDSLKEGAEVTKTIRGAGVVEVRCDLHDWMQGAVYVHDSPYAVLTGEDGSFSISDVPAGTYTVHVWHEVLGEQTAEITVTAGTDTTHDVAYE